MNSETAAAAERLRNGGLVAFPTETVYGLGADATSPEAVARIYAAKARPQFNPLIAHVATRELAEVEACFTLEAARLAEHFWPGPLTLVLRRKAEGRICDLACAGLESVGLRIPAHPIALDLLRLAGRPVAAPSANRSGRLSPTSAQDVLDDLGEVVDIVLDGGPCSVGVESTIVACRNDEVALLRPGGISRGEIERIIRRPLAAAGATIRAPGQLASHYAPNAKLRLEARDVRKGEVGLGFAGALPGAALDLSATADLRETAANLYRYLRTLDASGAATIAVASIPNDGLGAAINDRLRRAAAPR